MRIRLKTNAIFGICHLNMKSTKGQEFYKKVFLKMTFHNLVTFKRWKNPHGIKEISQT